MNLNRIADTGFLIGLLNPHDQHHCWAKDHAQANPLGFITCEAVIGEAVYLVRKSPRAKGAIIAMIESGWLKILPVLPEMRVAVVRVLESYHPHADYADYADACIVALYEQYGGEVFTADKRDFVVYRTRAGQMVTAVFP